MERRGDGITTTSDCVILQSFPMSPRCRRRHQRFVTTNINDVWISNDNTPTATSNEGIMIMRAIMINDNSLITINHAVMNSNKRALDFTDVISNHS